VLAAAHERGIPVQRITEDANLFQLGWGVKQKRIQATITGETSNIAVRIASDKQLTKRLLQEAGVPVPEGETVTSIDDALRVARKLAVPVTVKPLDANQGKGVTVDCRTPEKSSRPMPSPASTDAGSSSSAMSRAATTACSWPPAALPRHPAGARPT
jgi:cyanophycin synthetase